METIISYLARDAIFEKEKAFDTDFPVDYLEGVRATNHTSDERTVLINEIKEPDKWDLNVHGFCVVKAETSLDPHDAFVRKSEVQSDYWYQIEALLHAKFPHYSRIESYDYTVGLI